MLKARYPMRVGSGGPKKEVTSDDTEEVATAAAPPLTGMHCFIPHNTHSLKRLCLTQCNTQIPPKSTSTSPLSPVRNTAQTQPNANDNRPHAHGSPGASPSPHPKWQEPAPFPLRLQTLKSLRIKFSGSSHWLRPRCTAQAFTSRMVPLGMSYPPTLHCSDERWGRSSGGHGVQPQSLVDNATKVRELGEIGVIDQNLPSASVPISSSPTISFPVIPLITTLKLKGVDHVSQINSLPALLPQPPQNPKHLLFSNMGGSLEAARGEELDDGEAAEDPPELAVGRPRVGGVVVGEVVPGEGGGAVGEDDVVGGGGDGRLVGEMVEMVVDFGFESVLRMKMVKKMNGGNSKRKQHQNVEEHIKCTSRESNPGLLPWQGTILPLDHWCFWS
ncbi:hypothetical protein SASPL_134516 [Salvia splendens]|uniref:Uncharacterized protein n=1 Tax=Salvia splendens TaxID=180675 RepID=A0A8X8X4Z4_SALSN|nr:hypothetical protein SASPL_134516 [Salvia splendens]